MMKFRMDVSFLAWNTEEMIIVANNIEHAQDKAIDILSAECGVERVSFNKVEEMKE